MNMSGDFCMVAQLSVGKIFLVSFKSNTVDFFANPEVVLLLTDFFGPTTFRTQNKQLKI